jgi:tartrate dehydratase alpha subunit/fumarate hydratase class I-like protein
MAAITIGHSPKTVELVDGTKLHFWYANNKGGGCTNCTIIRSSSPRAAVSAKQENIIAHVKTSHWAGNVNFSRRIQRALGL